jgi:hypothetical protein
MNVIFGVYNGYDSIKTEKGGLYYFAKSLRKYNQDCKVIIICEKENVFKELEDFCNEHSFYIYSDFPLKYHMMFYRFEIYYDILSKWFIHDINKIMFSDIDDVIFQGDPFSIEFDEQIYCAAEKNIITDRNNWSSNLNRLWIFESHDITIYSHENFENQPVLCAGTILGKYTGILEYLKYFVDIQSKRKDEKAEKGVNDQGLYNIYIYNYTTPEFRKILPYKESQILTLDRVDFDSLNIKDNKILNEKGELYVILHQTNRCNLDFMKSLVDI